jgi:trehalose 6-phosphate phosphatase
MTASDQALAERPVTAVAATSIPLRKAALFLDLDGTLADFAERPDEVGPDADRNALLRRLGQALEGRLAIVSGRPIADVDRIVESACAHVGGTHGLERRCADGSLRAAEPHPRLSQVIEAFEGFAAARPGVLVERKALAACLHFRQSPQHGESAVALAQRLADETGMVLQQGRMMAELRTPGADKGASIRAFMAEPPFAGHVPIFVGDDLTDEPGFAAAQALGGHGVLVGGRQGSIADARLKDVPAVLDWLQQSLDRGAFRLGGAE